MILKRWWKVIVLKMVLLPGIFVAVIMDVCYNTIKKFMTFLEVRSV